MAITVILKTSVLERDIVNTLITNTKQEWKNELEGLKDRFIETDREIKVISEAQDFILNSTQGDEFNHVMADGEAGFELRHDNGDIYGIIWDNQKNAYDCLIERLI